MSPKGGFLSNLIADLRDRRLLPVIGLLVVAIVAVPFVLHKTPSVSAPPPVTPSSSAKDGAAIPAVYTGSEGVRVYQRRLTAMSEKNPFQDHFAPPPVPAQPDPSTTAPEPTPSAPGTSTPAAPSGASGSVSASAPSAPSETTPSVGDSGGSSSSSTSSTSSSTSNTTTDVKVKHKDYVLSYNVDVDVGPAGNAHPRTGVPELTFLPSESRPAAIYVGVTQDAQRALFMLSTDVTETAGGGSCQPSAVDCQFLALAEGDQRTITYQTAGGLPHKLSLKLTGIHTILVEKSKHSSAE